MPAHRLLTLTPDTEPLWLRLDVHEIKGVWTAMIVGDTELPPEQGQLKGLAFFGESPEEAEQKALAYPGCSEPAN